MQVLAGDLLQAVDTFEKFMSVWVKFGVLPERYMFPSDQLHPTEQYYPLRPELIESNTYLYQVLLSPPGRFQSPADAHVLIVEHNVCLLTGCYEFLAYTASFSPCLHRLLEEIPSNNEEVFS